MIKAIETPPFEDVRPAILQVDIELEDQESAWTPEYSGDFHRDGLERIERLLKFGEVRDFLYMLLCINIQFLSLLGLIFLLLM